MIEHSVNGTSCYSTMSSMEGMIWNSYTQLFVIVLAFFLSLLFNEVVGYCLHSIWEAFCIIASASAPLRNLSQVQTLRARLMRISGSGSLGANSIEEHFVVEGVPLAEPGWAMCKHLAAAFEVEIPYFVCNVPHGHLHTRNRLYYVVGAGRECGIFECAEAAALQVERFPGGQRKSFGRRAEAEYWYRLQVALKQTSEEFSTIVALRQQM